MNAETQRRATEQIQQSLESGESENEQIEADLYEQVGQFEVSYCLKAKIVCQIYGLVTKIATFFQKICF